MQILKEDVLRRILSSSRKLFLTYGYKETSMDRIAKEAEISKSNLYNYFTNKETIFEQLVSSTAKQINELMVYFETIDFDLQKNDTHFISQFTELMSPLFTSNKDGLLLLFEASKGTQYENSQEKLIDTFANKFARRIKTTENSQLIARVLTTGFVNGLISILKHSNNNDETKDNLLLLTKYHTYGIKVLFTE